MSVLELEKKDVHKTFLLVTFSGFEVNFMDDVGQTLLNWASAFGTQEMVRIDFICIGL